MSWSRSPPPAQRLHEMGRQPGSKCLHLVRRPSAKPLPRFEAEPPPSDVFLEQLVGPVMSIQIWDDRLVDVERQIESDQVGIFERPQYRQPQSKAVLHAVIERPGIADAFRDHGNGLAPQRMLQT